MMYKYEYTSPIEPSETICFSSKDDFIRRFYSTPIFRIFIERDEIDMVHIVCGTDSYKLRRVLDNEI